MRNYQQPGDVLPIAAPRAVTAGEGVLLNQMFGIAKAAAASGATVEIARTGVYNPVAKATGQVWAVGVLIYWDNTNFNFTTTASGNRLVGLTAAAAISGATTGSVVLDGIAR